MFPLDGGPSLTKFVQLIPPKNTGTGPDSVKFKRHSYSDYYIIVTKLLIHSNSV